MADPTDAEVIDLTARLKKRVKDAPIDPKDDRVVAIALEILKAIRDETEDNPMDVLTAMQVVNNAVGELYMNHFGREDYLKMATSASVASRMYEAKTGVSSGK